MSLYEVIVLRNGFSKVDEKGHEHACGTITLIKGALNIIVDLGGPEDRDFIERSLSSHKVKVNKMNYAICTHGHIDHVGNLNLFPTTMIIVGFGISMADRFFRHDFHLGIPYEIDDDIEVIPTPGHTPEDVSVVVRNTSKGTIVIAGDLFESALDFDDPHLWERGAHNIELQKFHRAEVLKIADYIVPGHGPMFKVTDEQRRKAGALE